MVTAADIKNIQALMPEEQALVFSLVRSLLNTQDQPTDAQKWFAKERAKYLAENPLSMEEIDRIIHEEP